MHLYQVLRHFIIISRCQFLCIMALSHARLVSVSMAIWTTPQLVAWTRSSLTLQAFWKYCSQGHSGFTSIGYYRQWLINTPGIALMILLPPITANAASCSEFSFL